MTPNWRRKLTVNPTFFSHCPKNALSEVFIAIKCIYITFGTESVRTKEGIIHRDDTHHITLIHNVLMWFGATNMLRVGNAHHLQVFSKPNQQVVCHTPFEPKIDGKISNLYAKRRSRKANFGIFRKKSKLVKKCNQIYLLESRTMKTSSKTIRWFNDGAHCFVCARGNSVFLFV